jgi:predicted nucleic acid-binding protein
MTRLFDSNVLIDVLNGVALARDAIGPPSERKLISIVTWLEVMAGTRSPREEIRARALMDRMHVIPLSSAIAEAAWRIRRDRRLKLPDSIILATARVEGIPLYTRNTKDFGPGEPLVVVPYTL